MRAAVLNATRSRHDSLQTVLVAKSLAQCLTVILAHAAFGARAFTLSILVRLVAVGSTTYTSENEQAEEQNRIRERDDHITNKQGRGNPCRWDVLLNNVGSEEQRDKELAKKKRDYFIVIFRVVFGGLLT